MSYSEFQACSQTQGHCGCRESRLSLTYITPNYLRIPKERRRGAREKSRVRLEGGKRLKKTEKKKGSETSKNFSR